MSNMKSEKELMKAKEKLECIIKKVCIYGCVEERV